MGQARAFVASSFYDALMLHLAEGIDAIAREEFLFMQSQSLLPAKGIAIHGNALQAIDFQAMAVNGTALVWSPRSNLELYGQTTAIDVAASAGVEIALAPDWAVTGSSNLLDELRFAASWNEEQLGGLFSHRQLLDMATVVPARLAGVDDEVGSIRPGLRADLIVVKARHRGQPYHTLVDSHARNVRLVLVGGVPLYGNRSVMRRFWDDSQLETVPLPRGSKQLATPATGGVVVAEVSSRLAPVLEAAGSALAELTEPRLVGAEDEDDDEGFDDGE